MKPRGLTCASKDENATEEAGASRAPAAARAARESSSQPRALAAGRAGRSGILPRPLIFTERARPVDKGMESTSP